MVLSTDVRKNKLSDIKATGESQGKQKLYYMGETQSFDVYRIDLDHLIYNRHTGRIAAELLTWAQANAAPNGTYDDERHGQTGAYLWDPNKGRKKATRTEER